MDIKRLKGKEIAEIWGVTGQAVGQWVKSGCPRNADGTYALGAVISWRETHLVEMAESEKPGSASPELERWRRHRADLSELDLKARRGELLDRADVERGRVERIVAVKSGMMALPRQLAPELVGLEQREIAQILRDALENLCREFAGQKPIKRG